MDQDRVDEMRRELAVLLDPGRTTGDGDLTISAEAGSRQTIRRLSAYFATNPQAVAVRLLVDGSVLGVGTRDRLADATAYAGPAESALSTSERASQPGYPTEFTVIRYTCEKCGSVAYRSFYDERFPPGCPDTRYQPPAADTHGPMTWKPADER